MTSVMDLGQSALDQLSTALNRALAVDPYSHQLLRSIDGRSAKVEMTDLNFRLYILADQSGIQLKGQSETPCDVLVKARFIQLLRAAKTGNPRGLSVEGDAELAQVLARIAHRLPGSTWEGISKKIGDGPSRAVERAMQRLSSLIGKTQKTLEYQLVEYFYYEKRMLPPKEEVDEFYGKVRDLTDDLERLKKRVDVLDRGQ